MCSPSIQPTFLATSSMGVYYYVYTVIILLESVCSIPPLGYVLIQRNFVEGNPNRHKLTLKGLELSIHFNNFQRESLLRTSLMADRIVIILVLLSHATAPNLIMRLIVTRDGILLTFITSTHSTTF